MYMLRILILTYITELTIQERMRPGGDILGRRVMVQSIPDDRMDGYRGTMVSGQDGGKRKLNFFLDKLAAVRNWGKGIGDE
jgi:hypothetical protein